MSLYGIKATVGVFNRKTLVIFRPSEIRGKYAKMIVAKLMKFLREYTCVARHENMLNDKMEFIKVFDRSVLFT